jgi:hypothetical protein
MAMLLAVSASAASAECAWVLWQHHVSTAPSSSWSIEGGYKTAAECATEQARWWDATMKDLSNREKYSRIEKVEGERPKSIVITVKKVQSSRRSTTMPRVTSCACLTPSTRGSPKGQAQAHGAIVDLVNPAEVSASAGWIKNDQY